MALRQKASADQLTPATCNKHLRAARWTVIKESLVVSKLITVDDLPRLTYFTSVTEAQIFRILGRFGLKIARVIEYRDAA